MRTHRASDPGPSECVLPLCELRFAPIDQHEPLVRMTHLPDTDPTAPYTERTATATSTSA
jgi:hypothetical protein